MGMVIGFSRHARASAGSRAAKAVSKSAVTPAAEAFSVINIADHHSAGTLSRCHHLETAGAPAPRSAAIASREGQSSMIDRNEAKSDMPMLLRPIVLKRKDILSGDAGILKGHNVLMSPAVNTKVIKDHFTARIAYARHRAGYTQATMAEALGFGPADDPKGQSKYHKYEKRSFIPHTLIPQFCALCDVTVGWLYNGPIVARPVEKRGRKPKASPAVRRRA